MLASGNIRDPGAFVGPFRSYLDKTDSDQRSERAFHKVVVVPANKWSTCKESFPQNSRDTCVICCSDFHGKDVLQANTQKKQHQTLSKYGLLCHAVCFNFFDHSTLLQKILHDLNSALTRWCSLLSEYKNWTSALQSSAEAYGSIRRPSSFGPWSEEIEIHCASIILWREWFQSSPDSDRGRLFGLLPKLFASISLETLSLPRSSARHIRSECFHIALWCLYLL